MNPVSAETKGAFYRPELDVLRFWCFLLVFLHHALPRAGETVASAFVDAGSFGMPVFFLLSSFLITELLLREQARTGTVHIQSFYLRRILRIWPLYFAFFTLCFVMGRTHLMMHPLSLKTTLFFALLAGNWYLVLFGAFMNPMIVLWSISVEEQFYLGWPWLMRLGGGRAVRWIAWTACPLSYVALFLLARRGADPNTSIWSNTFVQMQFFALGGSLALYFQARKLDFSIVTRGVLAALTVASWVSAAHWCRLKRGDAHITPEHACIGYFLVAVGTICTFLTFYELPIGPNPLWRVAIYLGKISYGLYVFHYFALLLAEGSLHHLLPRQHTLGAGIVLAFFLTILLASASYRFLERPMLRYKERFTFVHSRPL